ncbi:hypothetical protein Hneap_0946 [Halothiobacillus neapolitanus c2]|uniref:Uncharacterized protein n=1 Tax=Halothiobacillus neapolitanus (strain ATCC 23641 / DSM 15147 / CIP 104769 / NCIMB 8539 / c2) TaxID=555778 RepID=D0KZB4_HALNC|nr:hypothetical protein Hneap_0946 [Halothiobacillus neapolitanus c2]
MSYLSGVLTTNELRTMSRNELETLDNLLRQWQKITEGLVKDDNPFIDVKIKRSAQSQR